MKRLLFHPVDWLPVAVITAGVGLALLSFFLRVSTPVLVGLAVLSFAARSIAPVHQHCHAHRRLFRVGWLNGLYDAVLTLAAGHTTVIWELQHVRGHHRWVLDPKNDPAATGRFTQGGPLQRVIFTVLGDALSFVDALRIARQEREPRRWIRRLWGHQALQVFALLCMLVADPRVALVMFVVPNLLLRWMIFWFSFTQHHGAPGTNVYDSSITHLGWTNAAFLNVGHHTAHHEKPTLHWSLLPARTRVIMRRIPQTCLRTG